MSEIGNNDTGAILGGAVMGVEIDCAEPVMGVEIEYAEPVTGVEIECAGGPVMGAEIECAGVVPDVPDRYIYIYI
jgi:hypothetical protein